MGHDLKIRFSTAPQIANRLADNETYDILVSPPAVVDQGLRDGKLLPEGRTAIGRVGVGIIVRAGQPAPVIESPETLKQALLDADAVVYNTASTGLYLDKLFANLSILDALKPKTTRYPDGASVMEHIIRSTGKEIGFGAITEIRLFTDKGLTFVAPLPSEVQNTTRYDAALMSGARLPHEAAAVLQLLATPAAKAAFTKAGIE